MTDNDMRTLANILLAGPKRSEINPESAEGSFVVQLDQEEELVNVGFESNKKSGRTWLLSVCYDTAIDLFGADGAAVLRTGKMVRVRFNMEVIG